MKSYLCIEDTKEIVAAQMPEGAEKRDSLYFVLEAKNWKQAMQSAKKLGAKAVRVLTDKELESKAEDGSYDIEL